MSIRLMSQIWDNEDQDLSGSRLVILLCLADHSNDAGVCWPSIARLAKRSRLDMRSVMRHIKELESMRYLTIKRTQGRPNVYTVHGTPDTSVTGDKNVTTTPDTSVTPPLTTVSPKSSKNRKVEPSSIQDDEFSKAIDDLKILGLFNKTMLEQFKDLWPELAGRRDWVGKAITMARDNGAYSPAYAIKILANAVHIGIEPGHVNGKTPPADPNAEMTAKAKSSSAITARAIAELKAEGVSEDDFMFYNLLKQRTEAIHAAN